jgi:hypothetical protein
VRCESPRLAHRTNRHHVRPVNLHLSTVTVSGPSVHQCAFENRPFKNRHYNCAKRPAAGAMNVAQNAPCPKNVSAAEARRSQPALNPSAPHRFSVAKIKLQLLGKTRLPARNALIRLRTHPGATPQV